MTRPSGLRAAAAAALFFVLTGAVSAQSPMRQELDGLRQQAQILMAQASTLQPGARAAQIEEQLRFLTGQIEAFEFRLRQLEQGGAAGAVGAQAFPQQQAQAGVVAPADGYTVLGPPPQPLGELRVDAQGDPLNITGVGQDVFAPQPAPAGQASVPAGGQAGPVPQAVPAQPLPGQGGQVALAPSAGPDAVRDDYDAAYELVLRGDYEGARQAFGSFLSRHSAHELAPNANFWIGETHFQEGNFQNAARAYLETSQRYPQAAKAPESMLKLGLSLGQLNQHDAACSTYTELLRKYPRAEAGIRSRAQTEVSSLGC